MHQVGKTAVLMLMSGSLLLGGTSAYAAGDSVTAAAKASAASTNSVSKSHSKSKSVPIITVAPAKSNASKSANKSEATSGSLIPQIIKDVSPSVVGIIGKAEGGSEWSSERYNLAHGTGVILRSDGWIVTNAHVVKGLQSPTVVTSDGNTYKIRETYIDEISDLALIRINVKGLKPAVFAASAQEAKVGEQVIAIGTPISFSLRNSATSGIVSGLNRGVNAFYRLIQSDTAINPGNSGGPLVNMRGEVLGINTMKFSAVGVENMGFSIPSETVQYVVGQLYAYGEVRRPSLGVELEESWSAIVGLPSEDPLTVTEVISAQAIKAGIQPGDVLYSINGEAVQSVVDMNEMFKSFAPGDTVKLLMQSDGDIVIRKLKLSKHTAELSDEDEVF